MSMNYQSLWGIDQVILPDQTQILPVKSTEGMFGLLTVGELRDYIIGSMATQGDGWGASRTITLTGGIATGFVSLNGTQDVSLPVNINDQSLTIAKTIGLATLLLGLRLDVDAAATAASSFRYVGYKVDHNFLPGMLITKDLTGQWRKCTTADVNASSVAMVTKLTDANYFILCIMGRVVLTTSEWRAVTGEPDGLTQSNDYYMGLDGFSTKEEPSTGRRQVVFYAENTTTVIFNPGEVLDVTPGSFISGPIIADQATTATRWETARLISLSGQLSGTVSIDGSGDVVLSATIPAAALTTAAVSGLPTLLTDLRTDVDRAINAALNNSSIVFQESHGFVPGTVLTKSGLLWVRANRNSQLTTAVAFVGKVFDLNVFTAVTSGGLALTASQWNAITGGTGGLPAGQYLYLDNIDGRMTTVPPTDGIYQYVMTADTATLGIVDIGEPRLMSNGVASSSLAAYTGDVTTYAGGTVTTIAPNAVTVAKFQQIATASFLGRVTASTGNVEVLTAAQAKTALSLVKADVGLNNVNDTADANKPVSIAQQNALDLKLDSSTYTAGDILAKLLTVDGVGSGLDSDLLNGQTGTYFTNLSNATGTLGAGAFPALTGDVTTVSGALASTIANNAVSLAKFQQITTASFLGRVSATTGNVEVLTAAQVKTALGLTKSDVGLGNVDNTSDASKPISTATQTALNLKVSASLLGANNGVATLDSSGFVPASQLPSYVDDVLEYANFAALPVTGESSKLYITLDTSYIWRWTGSVYVNISSSSGTADTATKWTTARTITLTGKAAGSVSFDGSADFNLNVSGLTVTKSDVGLGSVDNTSDASKPISTAQQAGLDLKLNSSAYTAADVLSKLIGVDGPASGLDADLLDGQHGSYYTDLTNANGTLGAGRLPAFSGDISTAAGSSVTSIGANKVTLTQMAQIATASFLGRTTAATGNVEVLTAAQAKSALALNNVDNTSDINKPVSTAQQSAFDLKLNSAAYTAADVLTKILTVDGTTSGLDADLLDGQHGSYYTNLANASGTLAAAAFPALTGDVTTVAGALASTIANNAVTLAKFQQITTGSFLGRVSASTGNIEVLTASQVKTALSLVKADVDLGSVDNTSDANKPVSTAQQNAFDLKLNISAYTAADVLSKLLTVDGTGSGLDADMLDGQSGSYYSSLANATGTLGAAAFPALTGDVTTVAGALAVTIANNAVSVSKMQQIATGSFLGRVTAATGNVEVLSVSQVKTALGLVKADVGLSNVDNTSDASKPISTATQSALDAKVSVSLLGANNGVATLDGSGFVPASQLPSYVDDVLEYTNFATLPGAGAIGKLYVTLDTNYIWRWTGSSYVNISSSSGNADTATRWTTARTLTLTGKAAGSVSFDGSADFNLNVSGLTVTKADVGLGNVDNTSDADKSVSTVQQTALDLKLNSSVYTAADVLSKLLTVDGPGSGLDADSLDGQSSSYYSNLANATGTLLAGQMPALTGDVSNAAGSLSTTIGPNAVTLAKFQQVATASILGRTTAATGDVEVLTAAQVKAILTLNNVENTALSTWVGSGNINTVGTIGAGVWNATVIADGKIATALTGKTYNALSLTAQSVGFTIAGGSTSKTLTVAMDASVAGNNSGDQTIALTGDVTGSGTGSFAATIAANAVTLAKFQQIATASFVGRITTATGNAEVLTTAQAKTLLVLVKADVGLSNVDNTSDANKPVSTAQQTALSLKADLSSPALTDVPTTPTAAPGTNTTQIASTAFVTAAVAAGGGGNFGTVEIDFGSGQGSNEAFVAIAGQTGILAGSKVLVSIRAVATVNHTELDHAYAAALIGLAAGPATAGVGFTIYARSLETLVGKFNVNWTWG